MSSDEVIAFWMRFDEVVGAHAPNLFKLMAPPATESDIAEVERSLGMVLPPLLRQSYLQHNGSGEAWLLPGAFGVWCSISELPQLHASLPTKSVRVKRHPATDTRIDDEWIQGHELQPWPHHQKRLPFIRTMDEEVVAVDLFPGGVGTSEQIVHITKAPAIGLLAKSWIALLQPLVEGLSDGSIYWGVETEASGTVSWHYTKTRQPVAAWDFYPQACWLGYLQH